MKIPKLKPVLSLLLLSVFLVSCGKDDKTLVRRYAVMGGVILEIKFYNNGEMEQKAMQAAYEQVAAVDKTCNIYDPESELSRLNASAFEKSFKCSALLWEVLKKSQDFYIMTEGAFDVSSGPLMKLWGFHRKRKTLPTAEEIAQARKVVGLDKVIFNGEEKSIKFLRKGINLDLGGIAKGFAVEKAADAAKKCGVKSGLINLAGNAYCFPEPPPGKKMYVIGVRHPRDKTGLCGTVNLLGQSVATSGDYERYVVIDGQKFAHIMNPTTGRPIQNMLAVTVVTPSATASDALSTGIFIKGKDFAQKVSKKIPGTSVLIIKTDKTGEKTEVIKIGKIWGNCQI